MEILKSEVKIRKLFKIFIKICRIEIKNSVNFLSIFVQIFILIVLRLILFFFFRIPKMSSQRNYEVIDPITSIISCQDNGLVLPIVLFGVPVGTMLAHLQLRIKNTEQLRILN